MWTQIPCMACKGRDHQHFCRGWKKRRDMESAAVNFTIGEDTLGLST